MDRLNLYLKEMDRDSTHQARANIHYTRQRRLRLVAMGLTCYFRGFISQGLGQITSAVNSELTSTKRRENYSNDKARGN